MKTVYDLIRHRSALEIICRNCDNSSMLNNRYLKRRFGTTKVLAEIQFVCRRCRSQNYRVRLVADELAKPEPLKMQHFQGVYEKFLD